ncbi:MAG: CPBP family intramembrane metalloprotease [Chloroflexi bacterium]|nr:CPBP family intramembrane metalloprotease [Chloroflexota bacterium]
MFANLTKISKTIFTMRWQPNKDLIAIAVSWLLVVSALYTATFIVGSTVAGGMAYFGLYAILGATLFGIGIPLYWTVIIRKRPVSDLGLTRERLGLSIILQLIFAALQFSGAYRGLQMPALESLLPLISLALAIGFFEAIFWRGWVLLRLEECFGVIPAIVIGSILYSAYHIGYGMPASEMIFLFFIGVMYAVAFRITKNVFMLWPVFQPMGQLVTLIKDGLPLPLLASLGFIEALILMWVLIWLASRYARKLPKAQQAATVAQTLNG